MILTTASQRRDLIDRARTIAIVGASPNEGRASFFVFSYMRSRGRFTVVPVNPRVAEIAGAPSYADVADATRAIGTVDVVDVFRKPTEAPAVVRDAIAAGAKAVWFQYGVVNDEAIAMADGAGMDVVVDRCLKVETARFDGGLSMGGLDSGLITSKRRGA